MPGDKIRADGQGGWLDEECGEPDLDEIRADITWDAGPDPGPPSPGEFLAMRDPGPEPGPGYWETGEC